MAHPNKKDAASAHTAKMRRMTDGYGSADPAANIAAPSDILKSEGPEDSVGFGADSSAPRARADRGSRGRKTTAANPIATYARGGAVKHHKAKHRDTGGDVSTIEEANRDQALAKPAQRARGGRTKGKGGHTHVNVIVAPQGAGAGATPPPVLPVGGPPPIAAAPPPMPPRPPMMPPGAGMPPGGLPIAPGAIPPGALPPRAKGGRVKHRDQGGDISSGSDVPVRGGSPNISKGQERSLYPQIRARGGHVSHPDAKEDKALIMKTLRDQGLVRADHEVKRAKGSKVTSIHDMDAGAMSGPGRLEKIELHKHSGKQKAQAV